MSTIAGICLLFFVSVLLFAFIILLTEYWGWSD